MHEIKCPVTGENIYWPSEKLLCLYDFFLNHIVLNDEETESIKALLRLYSEAKTEDDIETIERHVGSFDELENIVSDDGIKNYISEIIHGLIGNVAHRISSLLLMKLDFFKHNQISDFRKEVADRLGISDLCKQYTQEADKFFDLLEKELKEFVANRRDYYYCSLILEEGNFFIICSEKQIEKNNTSSILLKD